ncbi:MAG TPA: hypothetical protein VKU39_21770 [Streptosporangiaceae bacterium]|nr:hypothetical protein [Streptosporangiaceae bacterium]
MTTTLAVIVLALVAVVVLSVLGFVVHALFTPWLLVPIAILLWVKFRPRRDR